MFLFNCCLLNVDELQDLRFQLDPIDRRSADTSLSFSNSANWIVAICNSSELIELYTETYTVKTRQKKPTSFISVATSDSEVVNERSWWSMSSDHWSVLIPLLLIVQRTSLNEESTSIALRLYSEMPEGNVRVFSNFSSSIFSDPQWRFLTRSAAESLVTQTTCSIFFSFQYLPLFSK